MINWKEVKPSNFEKFIFYVLGKMGFHDRRWYGKGGGDGGRDIVAYTTEELPFNLEYQRKWIFQCKKWGKMPSNNTIINEIQTARQHKPDFWVLVITVDPTPNQIDWFNRLNTNGDFPFKIKFIPLAVIEEIIYTYPESKNILYYGDINEGSLV
ncbi:MULTISPECIES: restriction endonuclease [Geobacillus]|uniref:restriction endonuclease n=1 Tax=Geobacillus TaxID=129337 RepID=UPI0007C6ACF7|nr:MULTISPECIES: restriction endonuclease [Geobacillus]